MALLLNDPKNWNRNTEHAILVWMVEERTFLPIPADYFYCSDLREAFLEIQYKYSSTGEIQQAIYSDKTQAIIYDGMGIATTTRSEPLVLELRRLWQRREVCKLILGFTLSDDTHKSISSISKRLNELFSDEKSEYSHGESVASTSLYIYDSKNNGKSMLGISSNLETVDYYLNGWQKKKTYIIGGMEKLGKSRFCLELAATWLSKKIGGCIFSMEMSENDIHECILGNRAIIDTSKFGTSNITDQEIAKMSTVCNEYINEPLYISTKSSATLEHIRAVIRQQKIKMQSAGYNCVWVIVDYIQRMVEGDDRAGKLEDVAKGLADIARDEDVIMIVISQLSQASERDAHPDYSPHRFIKGSKGIREAADAIMVIYKTKDENHYVYIVQRKGRSDISIKLIPQLEYSRFRDEKF